MVRTVRQHPPQVPLLTKDSELVAEHTKKALVVVSAAHLGITVTEIDRGLSTLLEYAAAWKAIVLIDEADVFLEARTSGGSNRLLQNAVVAGMYI